MYGGGFATIPAYLADLFGVSYVERDPRPAADGLVDGRHPRAGAGQLHPRVPDRPRRAAGGAYTFTMYVLAGFLVVGLVCNLAIRPVPDRLFGAPVTAKPVSSSVGHAGVSTRDARSGGAVADRRRRVGARRDAVGVGCAEDVDARESDVPLSRSRCSGCFQGRRRSFAATGNTGDQEGRRSGGPSACNDFGGAACYAGRPARPDRIDTRTDSRRSHRLVYRSDSGRARREAAPAESNPRSASICCTSAGAAKVQKDLLISWSPDLLFLTGAADYPDRH